MWNLCVEQEQEWRPGRGRTPGFAERCRQLTAARAENAWLAEGSVIVQQQAIKDHQQAMTKFLNGTHGRPRWRRQDQDEGFRIVAVGRGDVRRLNRNHAMVRVPKAGWVRFRWSRPVSDGVKSFRVTRDRSGRWHIAFAIIPDPVPGPGTGEVVGVDRGVAVSAALSTGELLCCPGLSTREPLGCAPHSGSSPGQSADPAGAARPRPGRTAEGPRGRQAEGLVRASLHQPRAPFDVIRVEDLKVRSMTRSAKGTQERPVRTSRQSRAQHGHPNQRLGAPSSSTRGKGTLEGREEYHPRTRASVARRAGMWT